MEAVRRGEDPPLAAAIDGCGEWKCQRSRRHRRSRLKQASSSSDPKKKLLDEKTSFPNVSMRQQDSFISRLKQASSSSDPKKKLDEKTSFQMYLCVNKILSYLDPKKKLLDEKTSFPNVSMRQQDSFISTFFYVSLRSTYMNICPPPGPDEEYEFRYTLDAETPIYSPSLEWKPKIEVGEQLNVLDLLGGELCFSLNTGSKNVPSIQPTKFTSSVGLCDPMMGADRGFGRGMCASMSSKGSPNVQRIQSRKFSSDVASASVTTPRKNGVNMESNLILKGKYVMICCVFAPSLWSSEDARMLYHTALASHELARRDDFVLVVVPMMRKGFTHSYRAYQHFLSGFTCFAVPFLNFRRREYICSALGFAGRIKALILDPSQKVLYHGWPYMFRLFGGAEDDAFPFVGAGLETYLFREHVRRDHSLNELLGLGDTDVLYNIEYLLTGGGGRLLEEEDGGRITVSELKQKVVGIYVCSSGWSLRRLLKVYEECKRRGYELEIVVVGYPFVKEVPPKLYEKVIIDALASVKRLDWWLLPFNNTVCHKLWRIREYDYGDEECLFIVDPSSSTKYVDPFGMHVIYDFGVDGYPFSVRRLIEEEFQRKMELRLEESLLHHWTHVCRKHDDSGSIIEKIPLAQVLKNKIVLLYLYNKREIRRFAEKLAAWYENKIKGKHRDVEVVAVSLYGIKGGDDDKEFMEKGWLVCPAHQFKSAKLCREYFHHRCRKHEVLVAFGKDGRIQSVDGSQLLASHGPPFNGNNNLRAEIGKEFSKGGFPFSLGHACGYWFD